jgi:uncharacterized protein (DUF1330 family)
MSAYVIYHQTELTDPEIYQRDYLVRARASIASFGGKQLVGGAFEVMEGDWPGPRIVVHEFPDMDTLKAWYNSDEFQQLIAIRQSVSKGNLIIADSF